MRALLVVTALAGVAHAERPVLVDEATIDRGSIRVHYATTGADAATLAFATEVAEVADDALVQLTALGFRRPLDDGALGGDNKIDFYLKDLSQADGNVSLDSCDGDRCIGFAQSENDFVGFGYPSVGEGIRSVVPHELFHLIQNAYSTGQSSTWSEGSAVWAVEHLYGDGNSDFERFQSSFLTKTFRPFERPAGGFGDAFPYGASMWPVFLEQQFGAAMLVEIWEACEQEDFLDATALVTDLDGAWIGFTRANAAFSDVPREPVNASAVAIEGLSARYVPLSIAERSRVTLSTSVRIAAAVNDQSFVDNTAILEPGDSELVITGLSQHTLATPVEIAIEPAPDDSGGCRAVSPALALAFLIPWRRRRRSRTVQPCTSGWRS